jgi:eukaryotic-like serine/threonine-protein kinase
MSINRRERATVPRAVSVPLTVGLAALVTLVVPACRRTSETPPPPPAFRLALPDAVAGAGLDYPFGLTVAPDGRRLAFPTATDGRITLVLRDLTTGESRTLPATDGAAMPFWSHDGARLGYFAGGRLRVLEVDAGTDTDVVAAPSPRGGAWLPSGDLLLAPAARGSLVRYRTASQEAEPFTELDAAAGELSHGLPVVSADGRHAIFHVQATTPGRAGIWWAPIDRPAERRRLTGSDAHGLLSRDVLLFANDTALMAQRIDLAAGGLLGRPTMIATPVGRGPLGQLFATVADEGPLLFSAPASALRTLTWVDRSGTTVGTVGSPADSWDLRLAPAVSEREASPVRRGISRVERVAVTQVDAQLGTLDVWAYDGSRPLPLRISTAIEADDHGVWSPDGLRVAWVQGRRAIVVRGAQAMLEEETVRRFDAPVRLWDWSHDGRWLIVGLSDGSTRDDLWALASDGRGDPQPLVRSPFRESDAALSPDGRWIAFASDESGRNEIYVDAFPTPSRRVRLTLGGGTSPRWRGDGRELFFRRGREIHVVALARAAETLEATSTTMLFETPGDIRAFDVTNDGAQLLLNLPASAAPPPVQVIVNWRTLTYGGPGL